MDWSVETAMAPSDRPMACNPRLRVRLVHVSGGKRIAGAGVCEEREGYAVRWDDNGTAHGRTYATLSNAMLEFDRITCACADLTAGDCVPHNIGRDQG